MMLEMLKAKIHRAHVSEANLNYVGSITLDGDLLEATGILPGERVQIVNNNNGARFETYVIEGPKGSGMVCLNGAAARLAQVGDVVIIMAYCWLDAEEAKSFKPTLVYPNDKNLLTQPI